MGMGGKRQKPPKEDENILKLPSQITVEILSRLPVKTIIQCKTVCKAWHNVLLDPCFPQIHLAKSSVNLMLCRFSSYWLVEFEKDFHKRKMSRFSDENMPGTGVPYLVGTCNGLLCLSINYPEDVYVWNPVRNESVTLPVPNIKAGNRLCSLSVFGFCPRTDVYKVIRMVRYSSMASMGSSNQAMCEVYTLGTKDWRTIGDVPVPSSEGLISKMPFNGAVHWICSFKINDEKFPIWICAFKIEDENWDPILLPLSLLEIPGLEFTDQRKKLLLSWLQLGVLENCLVIIDKSQDSLLNIWMMKNHGVRESWTKVGVFSCLLNPQQRMPRKQKISGVSKLSKGIAYVASFISAKEVMKEESKSVVPKAISLSRKVQSSLDFSDGDAATEKGNVEIVENIWALALSRRK
ncbi:hypothetical protein DITRI_Ditri01bG0120900 [Diplodiscus trichospermus]